jgi:hypothetical protein
VVVFEVPADRVGSGIETLAGEASTEIENQIHGRRRSGIGTGMRSPRSRLERRVALGAIAGHQLVDP